jgi:RNA polymerase sigma-70 factor (ECF subfamily)
MNARTDQDLVSSFRDHQDREALVELVSRYQGPLYTYLLSVLRDPQKAEDAAQETFLRMLRGLPGYRSELSFRPWIYRIALNAARTLAHQSAFRLRKEREAAAGLGKKGSLVDPSDRAFQAEVDAVLGELPLEQRDALTLHYSEGLSHSEVAHVLGVPPGTAATRIHQGLQSLRSRFAPVSSGVGVLDLGRLLGRANAVAAPKSILKGVLAQASGVVSGAVATETVLSLGGAVAKSKVGLLAATALICLVAGGLGGYQIQKARSAPVVSGEPEVARSKTRELQRTVDSLRHQLEGSKTESSRAASGTAEGPRPHPAPAGAPKATSLLRKIAAHLVEEERVCAEMKDRRHPTPEEEEKLTRVMAKMFSDPEMITGIKRGDGWSADEKTEFTVDLLEELGLPPLVPGQTDLIKKAIGDWDHVAKTPVEEFSSVVEKRMVEIGGNAALLRTLKSVLSDLQQPLVPVLEQSGFVGLSETRPRGFVLSPPAAGQAASYILNSWSKQIVELDDADRARLADAASAHADRLWIARSELEVKYGQAYVDFLSETLKTTLPSLDLESLQEAARNPGTLSTAYQTYKDGHPGWATELQDGYLRLLEAEKENREALLSFIPDKVKAIRSAKPYVYLMAGYR